MITVSIQCPVDEFRTERQRTSTLLGGDALLGGSEERVQELHGAVVGRHLLRLALVKLHLHVSQQT